MYQQPRLPIPHPVSFWFVSLVSVPCSTKILSYKRVTVIITSILIFYVQKINLFYHILLISPLKLAPNCNFNGWCHFELVENLPSTFSLEISILYYFQLYHMIKIIRRGNNHPICQSTCKLKSLHTWVNTVQLSALQGNSI